ncbi:hypothetical protein [Yoonia sp.]|uniref:hypothetical protein n=1 Tax=Yoonia sp. TaxID=2212373 RepID=UPI0035C7DF2C
MMLLLVEWGSEIRIATTKRLALIIYLWLGLKFLSYTWFNLDLVWAISLIAVGAFGVWSAVNGH